MIKKISSLLLVGVFVTTILLSSSVKVLASSNEKSQANIMTESGYLEITESGEVIVTDKYVEYIKDKLEDENINSRVIVEGNTISIIDNIPLETDIFRLNTDIGVLSGGGGGGGAFSYNTTKIEWTSSSYFELYLSTYRCNQVVALSTGVAGFLAILVPDPFFSKGIAAALILSATAIGYTNAKQYGVIVYGRVLPSIKLYLIKSQ